MFSFLWSYFPTPKYTITAKAIITSRFWSGNKHSHKRNLRVYLKQNNVSGVNNSASQLHKNLSQCKKSMNWSLCSNVCSSQMCEFSVLTEGLYCSLQLVVVMKWTVPVLTMTVQYSCHSCWPMSILLFAHRKARNVIVTKASKLKKVKHATKQLYN